jgi:tripartite-type tricarboxylate transporter receptor subunit TctC
MEELALAAGIELHHIPYKGGAPALQDLLGGQIDVLADSSTWALHVQTGRLRLLATWGATRTQGFPEVPTLRDAGYDVVVDAPNGVGAPKGLDPIVESKLRSAFRQATVSPVFVEACARLDVPVVYLDGPDYEKYVAQTYRKDTLLIEKLKLKEALAKG